MLDILNSNNCQHFFFAKDNKKLCNSTCHEQQGHETTYIWQNKLPFKILHIILGN